MVGTVEEVFLVRRIDHTNVTVLIDEEADIVSKSYRRGKVLSHPSCLRSAGQKWSAPIVSSLRRNMAAVSQRERKLASGLDVVLVKLLDCF